MNRASAPDTRFSSYRERLIEHLFVGEVLRNEARIVVGGRCRDGEREDP